MPVVASLHLAETAAQLEEEAIGGRRARVVERLLGKTRREVTAIGLRWSALPQENLSLKEAHDATDVLGTGVDR